MAVKEFSKPTSKNGDMGHLNKILAKMGICYGEQSEKGFKAKLKVSEEELKKYLESWVLPNLVRFANLFHQRKRIICVQRCTATYFYFTLSSTQT